MIARAARSCFTSTKTYPALRGRRHRALHQQPSNKETSSVKIQQRTSGGAWRTLKGLADFAIVQSYLSTATKWGLDHYDVLYQLFTAGAWLPLAAEPC